MMRREVLTIYVLLVFTIASTLTIGYLLGEAAGRQSMPMACEGPGTITVHPTRWPKASDPVVAP